MVSSDKKRGLGRGLSALMADVNEPKTNEIIKSLDQTVAIERIRPNPNQPRKNFESNSLDDLIASIKEKGVLQPLIVRAVGNNFEIVAGERRWRAAQKAQIHKLPVIIRNFTDAEVLEVAIIENIQRADLNPIEEAASFRQLMERFGHTQEMLAEALGKSRSYIANLLRLLNLPKAIQEYVLRGDLSAGHARALITIEKPEIIVKKIIKDGLSVRQTEALVRKLSLGADEGTPKKEIVRRLSEKDADTRALESDLSAALGLKVSLSFDTNGQTGQLKLRYNSLDQLDDLCRKLSI
ncbi:MAG: ParB/RepB/Spo0J family partition protein [Tateyamaria sp.]|nr:ParB/RepB/Spo0J family partition protein [Tateyamaria sp.]MDG1678883.1 ParB/RepB/Spo0J family partition protein [Tateyamaria sp.]MDG2379992.1 ParB/RepB/Spo0J family partition protein [Tateyamaria sp.]